MNGRYMLPERIEQIREIKGLTQQTMADLVGVSRMAYRYYERGERVPNVQFLISMSEVTGFSLDYLMGVEDEPATRAPSVSEVTHLSEKAISVLAKKGAKMNLEPLSALIEHPHFEMLIGAFEVAVHPEK